MYNKLIILYPFLFLITFMSMRKIIMNRTYRKIQIAMPICNRVFNSCSIVHSCALSLLKSTLVKYTSFQQTLQYDKQKHTLECSPHGLSACAWGRVNTYKKCVLPSYILLGTTLMYLIVKLGG